VKQRRPDLRIGFFLHVPFPAPEIFGQLPWRHEVLAGTCGADIVGFQTAQDAANFQRAAARWAPGCDRNAVDDTPPMPRVGCYPISVDFAHWSGLAAQSEVQKRAVQLREELGSPRTILLGIDRLDYIKGID